jgi:riboflavin-specific deaminase-like protein
MQQLFPADGEPVELDDLYLEAPRKPPDGRSYVTVNMVASLDGGTAVGGVSGPLGGRADKAIFATLRAVPDVILVGRRTIEAENYGPPDLKPEYRKQRVSAGKNSVPSVAVVSNELDLDWNAAFFTEAEVPPLVISSHSCSAKRRSRAEQVAELLITGEERVDLRQVLVELRLRGLTIVLCEGGPTLNGGLAEAGVIDELCLTLSPGLVGGSSSRIINGHELGMSQLELVHALEDEAFLFLRYQRRT